MTEEARGSLIIAMGNLIYGYRIEQEEIFANNRVFVASDPYTEGKKVYIYQWQPGAERWRRSLEKAAGIQATLESANPGVKLLSMPGCICLAADSRPAAREALKSLRTKDLAGDTLFTGPWPEIADAAVPPAAGTSTAGTSAAEAAAAAPQAPRLKRKSKARGKAAAIAAAVCAVLAVSYILGRRSAPPPPARIESFYASPSSITQDQGVTLSWNAPGASTVELWAVTLGAGKAEPLPTPPLTAPAGQIKQYPQRDTVYELHALGADKLWVHSVPRIVAVRAVSAAADPGAQPAPPPREPPAPQAPPLIIEYFGFAPNTVLQGKEATLSWKVTGVRRVFIEPEPGNVPAEGGHVFTPQQTATYRLTAYDASGKGYESSASVTVLPSLALNRFEVTPASVAPGQPVAITWDVRGARSVEILPRPGPSPSSGSAEDRPSVDTDYVLQAIDFSGRLNSFPAKHVSVVPPAAILSFGVARDSPVLRAGDVARLEWRTQNATYVELGQVGRAAADVSGLNSMSVPLPGAGTYSYQLSARGPAGGPTARQVVTLVVVPRLRSGSMVWQGNIGRSVREMVTVKGGSANFGRVISGEMPGFACTVDAVPPNVVILRTDPNCSWISIDVRGQGITRVELRWTERARP